MTCDGPALPRRKKILGRSPASELGGAEAAAARGGGSAAGGSPAGVPHHDEHQEEAIHSRTRYMICIYAHIHDHLYALLRFTIYTQSGIQAHRLARAQFGMNACTQACVGLCVRTFVHLYLYSRQAAAITFRIVHTCRCRSFVSSLPCSMLPPCTRPSLCFNCQLPSSSSCIL